MSSYDVHTTGRAVHQKIGEAAEEIASEIFDRCGAHTDYCIQHVASTIVFGGTNRLIFSFRSGWHLDEAYCTPGFIAAWNEIKDSYA